MDFLEFLHPNSWQDRTFLWVYLAIAVFTYLIYSKVSQYFYHKSIYARGRVKRLEEMKRSAWFKKQVEINPNIEPEENKPRIQNTSEKFEEENKKDRKKFKKIFGMDNIKSASCNSGS